MNQSPETNCPTCPQATPTSLETDAAAAPHDDCHCAKVRVRVTAARIKVGSLHCYAGAEISVCADKATAMVAAGHATHLPPSY